MADQTIAYTEKYYDDAGYEYRHVAFQIKGMRWHEHVMLPKHIAALLPKNKLLSEPEWRALGVQQSRGWVHYALHRPEPHILLFKRPRDYNPSALEQRLQQRQLAA